MLHTFKIISKIDLNIVSFSVLKIKELVYELKE